MLTSEQLAVTRPRLVSTQIIAGALLVGVLLFATITFLMIDTDRLGNPLRMLTLFATVTSAAMFGLAVIAPGMFASGVQRPNPDSTDEEKQKAIATASNAIFVETLIRFCLIEAAIFLSLMVFFIEPHYATLVVVGIGVLLMLFFFPRQSKMVSKIEDQIGSR